MNRIGDLKKKKKELEYNKKQLEAQIEKVMTEIEILNCQRFYLNAFGYIANIPNYFDDNTIKRLQDVGNYFETIEEAEKEVEKRELLKEVEDFRKECNNGWEPDWYNIEQKYYIATYKGEVSVYNKLGANGFAKFGYFKHFIDAEKAIELFGDRILTLYVD